MYICLVCLTVLNKVKFISLVNSTCFCCVLLTSYFLVTVLLQFLLSDLTIGRNHNTTISLKLPGQNIRKLVKDGFIIKKPQKIHSRSRARRAHEAKQKGRHSGYGIPLQCIFNLYSSLLSKFINLLSVQVSEGVPGRLGSPPRFCG
jgi:hypothetical protein